MDRGTSVVICAYNDPPDALKSCINSILKQKKEKFELVIVDSSETTEIKKSISNLEKIRYIHAQNKGLSFARNTGIENAKYDIVAFTDPDCIVSENWLEEISKPLELFEDVAVSGGKVFPIWPKDIPFLMKSDYARFSLSILDLGDEPKIIGGDQMIVGANFAVYKEKIEKIGSFDSRVGRKNSTLLSGEETELCSRIRAEGYKIFYSPRAVVYHKISPSKLTYRWMLKRAFWGGATRSIIDRRLLLSKREIGDRKLNSCDVWYIVFFSPAYFMGYSYGRLKK